MNLALTFWTGIYDVFWVGPGLLYQDTLGNLTSWLKGIVLNSFEKGVKHLLAGFLTALGTVFDYLASAYNGFLQVGVDTAQHLGILGATAGILILVGIFLSVFTALRVMIKFIP